MTATVSQGDLGELETVVLENANTRLVVIPALGGRIWELEDCLRGRQWIWHRGGTPLRAWPPGTCYDDVWAGGWEELFPNDAPGTFEGRDLPDHGEWWTKRWSVIDSSTGPLASVRLSATCTILRAHCVKEIQLANDDSTVTIHYRIRSAEPEPFHFLFKQHLPIDLTPHCRLCLPGGTVQPVDPGFSTVVHQQQPSHWPLAGGRSETVDLSVVPPADSLAREFLYVRDLPQPWCGIDDRLNNASIRMRFDSQQLPYVWLFLTYGGWRNLYTVVLEPCTNLPKDLPEAVRLRQSARLDPGEEFRATVSVTLGGSADTKQ